MGTINLEIAMVKPEICSYREKFLFIYGSRGSGKSTSTAHKVIRHAIESPQAKILVTRKTLPSLKVTAMSIILEELQKYEGIPWKEVKTDNTITFFNKSSIFFIPMYLSSGSRNERLKSSTFDWIWIEEATEFTLDDVKDVLAPTLRGRKGWRQMIFTFNPPARKNHWIYNWFDIQNKRKRARKVHFHWKDNPFLPEDFIEELESLKEYDEGLWRRYSLGEWGVDVDENLIFTNWDTEILEGEADEWIGGVDFGYNNPSVFLLIGLKDEKDVYIHREIYERRLLNREFGERILSLLEEARVSHDIPIFADSSEPDRIEELCRMGLNVYPADRSDVLERIDFVKGLKLHIDPTCRNTLNEIQSYEWMKDKDGNVLDRPVKAFDHAMDSMTYALWSREKFVQPDIYVA